MVQIVLQSRKLNLYRDSKVVNIVCQHNKMIRVRLGFIESTA